MKSGKEVHESADHEAGKNQIGKLELLGYVNLLVNQLYK